MGSTLYFVCLVVSVLCVGANSFHINNSVKSNAPDPDLMFCADTAVAIERCWSLYDFPFCNGTKSQLQQCADQYLPNLSKCKISLIRNALKTKTAIYIASDTLLCKDSLYTHFESNKVCWNLAKSGMLAVTGLVKGLLTKDGCKVAALNNEILLGYGSSVQGCDAIIQKYLKPLFDKSPCSSKQDDY